MTRVSTPRTPLPLQRVVVAFTLAIAALVTGAAGASAVAPLDHLEDQITDQVGALTPETRAELQQALDKMPADRSLYVVYVDSFDGLDGAQWAAQTHDQAGLGSAWLFAVATGDRLWGTGYSTGTDSNVVSAVNHVAQSALSDFAENSAASNWANPAIAVAHAVADPESVDQGLSVAATFAIVLGAIAAVGALVIPLSIRSQRLAKERAEAEFNQFWAQGSLPSDPQESLAVTRRQISIAVDFLTAHDAMVSPLATDYVQLAMDMYESVKSALAAGQGDVFGRPIPQVLEDARAFARAGLGTAASDVGDGLGPEKLRQQFGFDMTAQTWMALQSTVDYPAIHHEVSHAGSGGFREAVGGTFGPEMAGTGGSFGQARTGSGGYFTPQQGGFGGSFGSRTGTGGSFAPTHSFDRGRGGDLYVEPASSGGSFSSASFGGSSGSGGSF